MEDLEKELADMENMTQEEFERYQEQFQSEQQEQILLQHSKTKLNEN